MLLIAEKGIGGGMCHPIYQYEKAHNKHKKDSDKNTKPPCLQYWDINNFYGWEMSQKLQVNNFEWIKDHPQFNEDFIKNYNKEDDEEYFFEADVSYTENYMNFIMIYHFYLSEWKLKKTKSFVANLHDKTEYIIHIRNSKQPLNNGLVLKKFIEWLKLIKMLD